MGYFRLRFSNFALVVVLIFCFAKVQADPKVFNVKDYGAVEGGQIDINEALLKAWNASCKYTGQAQLEIPEGDYLVKPIVLVGECKGPVVFLNKGTLKAPVGLQGLSAWITFQYINGLTVHGGGSFDGSGPPQHAAPNLPALLKFNFVTSLTVKNVRLVNSMSTHLDLFACNNTKITRIGISSPGDSPNTDGIKMGVVRGVTIADTTIASGDDCVAILTGSTDVTVTRVQCGPGHGISIGSLGGSPNELVRNITVSNCNFMDTMNGVRIKTKATSNPGLVSDVQFQDLTMHGADNPILIEQNYCPSKTCGPGDSKVQIKNVKYSNIRGTSKAANAVRLECSASNPCEDIELKDIDLVMEGGQGATIATCSNVKVRALGTQIPKACN